MAVGKDLSKSTPVTSRASSKGALNRVLRSASVEIQFDGVKRAIPEKRIFHALLTSRKADVGLVLYCTMYCTVVLELLGTLSRVRMYHCGTALVCGYLVRVSYAVLLEWLGSPL